MLQPGSRRHTTYSCGFNGTHASGVVSVCMLFIAIRVLKYDSFYFSVIVLYQPCFFFVAVSANGIEYSWVNYIVSYIHMPPKKILST